MNPIRIILAVTLATAALLAQGLFPRSAAAPVDAPPMATCDRAASASGRDAHVVTSVASLQHEPACAAD